MPGHIYTRTGDSGDTGLFGGQRVSKHAVRVDAYGTVDELNALLGVARAQCEHTELAAVLEGFQRDLFQLGADLATPEQEQTSRGRVTIRRVEAAQVVQLENLIDRYEAELPPLTRFILPGGHPLAAALHHSRTVCRRAERRCVELLHPEPTQQESPINPEILRYLNRLSDLLFVLARVANRRNGQEDVFWNP